MRKTVLLAVVIFLFSVFSISFAGNDYVDVKLPEFDVRINGVIIDNYSEEYPFIVYNGITYIPMTWDMSNAIGLKLKWNEEDGLSINKNDSMTLFSSKENGKNEFYVNYKASILSFPVKVNDKIINNMEEEYPLLSFRNVTYFPMTYDYMVTEFGSNYNWDSKQGLSVDADEKLKVIMKDPIVHKETLYKYELDEKGIFFGKYIKIEDGIYGKEVTLNYNQNDELNNYLFDLEFNYYDIKNNYMHTKLVYIGRQYYSKDEGYKNYNSVILGDDFEYGKIEIEMIFRSPSEALYLLNKENIEVEYLPSNEITVEKMKNDGGEYCYAFISDLDDYSKIGRELYNYNAIKRNARITLKDGEEYELSIMLGINGEESVSYYKISDEYMKIKYLSEFKFLENSYYMIDAYMDGNFVGYIQGGNIKLYDENKKLIKVYVNTSKSN